jgi:hypothetical protein
MFGWSAFISSADASDRTPANTLHPFAASCAALALPMPLLAPLITTVGWAGAPPPLAGTLAATRTVGRRPGAAAMQRAVGGGVPSAVAAAATAALAALLGLHAVEERMSMPL